MYATVEMCVVSMCAVVIALCYRPFFRRDVVNKAALRKASSGYGDELHVDQQAKLQASFPPRLRFMLCHAIHAAKEG